MSPDGVGSFPVVKDFVLYQIYLGKNLTTDFSVYSNNNLTYNITLKGRSDDDTNVIRFIPGYFSGELKAYDANDNALASKPIRLPLNGNIPKDWRLSFRIASIRDNRRG